MPTLLNLVKPGFSIKDVMARWGDVLKKLIFDEEDQADLLKLDREMPLPAIVESRKECPIAAIRVECIP